mmetsp:Transcript_66922/g.160257  ORF Transcript_66922/g.160257 Transcript_66922/m.160257 type:complete len:324 (+) Transcript_66922:1331-2302(+)
MISLDSAIVTAGLKKAVTSARSSLSVHFAFSRKVCSACPLSGPEKTRYSQLKWHWAPKSRAKDRSSRASITAKAIPFQRSSSFAFLFADFATFAKISSWFLHCVHHGNRRLAITVEYLSIVLLKDPTVNFCRYFLLSSKYGTSSSGSSLGSSLTQSLSMRALNFLASGVRTSHLCVCTLLTLNTTPSPHFSGLVEASDFAVSTSTSSRNGKLRANSSPFVLLAAKLNSMSGLTAMDTELLSRSRTITVMKTWSLVCAHLNLGVVGLPSPPAYPSAKVATKHSNHLGRKAMEFRLKLIEEAKAGHPEGISSRLAMFTALLTICT